MVSIGKNRRSTDVPAIPPALGYIRDTATKKATECSYDQGFEKGGFSVLVVHSPAFKTR